MDTSKCECTASTQTTASVRPSRPYGLRLVFAMMALGVVLWVLEIDLLLQARIAGALVVEFAPEQVLGHVQCVLTAQHWSGGHRCVRVRGSIAPVDARAQNWKRLCRALCRIAGRFIHKHSALYVDMFVFLDNKTKATLFGPMPSICFVGCHRCPQLSGWRIWNPQHHMGDLDKPLAATAATAPASTGVVIPTNVTKDAAPRKGRLATILSRPRRLSVLRLAITIAALCVVLLVFSSDLLWQMTQRSGSSGASLLATPNLRANSTTSTITTEPKQCVKLSMGHVEKMFFRADNCLSRSDIQQIILGLVWTLADVFEKNGIPYWLDSGTLLGSVREKTVISYDVDADVGISEASYFQLRDNKFEYPSETYELLVLGGKYHRSGPRDANIPARFIHKDSALYVDIFVFLDNKSDPAKFGPIPSVCFAGCYRCPKLGNWVQEFTIPRDWVYPLQSCPFGSKNVSCPAKPELYLDYLYGEKFMTPDKEAR